jgi:hypothetical protein
VEGFATLTGTWAADRLQVERQDLYARQQRKIPTPKPSRRTCGHSSARCCA